MYYKDTQNKLYFLSDEDIAAGGENLLPAGVVQITGQEAEAVRIANIPPLTQEQIDAAAKVAKDAADALAVKQDVFVSAVAGFTMVQVDNFVDTNFASSTAAQKNFFKALGKIAVISARKL